MSDPLYGSLYVDQVQTGTAVRRLQNDMRFLASRMVPKMIVKKPSGLYPVFNMGDLNRDEMEARGPTGRAKKGGWRTKLQPFSTDARSLEFDLNDAEAAGADVDLNPDILIPTVLAYKAKIHLERRMVGKYMVGGVWKRNITGGANDANLDTDVVTRKYLDDAAADPIEVFTDEARRLSLATGASKLDMGLTFGTALWHKIRNHAKVKSSLIGLAGGPISDGIIAMAKPAELPDFARLIGIKWCAVGEAIYNVKVKTSDPNEAPDNQPIVPENDALLFVNTNAGDENGIANLSAQVDNPPAFARPVWNGVASGEGIQIRKVRDEFAGPSGSWVSIIDVYQGMEVVSTDSAVRFTEMLTP